MSLIVRTYFYAVQSKNEVNSDMYPVPSRQFKSIRLLDTHRDHDHAVITLSFTFVAELLSIAVLPVNRE